MASTGTLSVAVGSTAAAVTFAVVSIVGSASTRPDLGGPVVVESPTTVPTPAAEEGAPPGDESLDEN